MTTKRVLMMMEKREVVWRGRFHRAGKGNGRAVEVDAPLQAEESWAAPVGCAESWYDMVVSQLFDPLSIASGRLGGSRRIDRARYPKRQFCFISNPPTLINHRRFETPGYPCLLFSATRSKRSSHPHASKFLIYSLSLSDFPYFAFRISKKQQQQSQKN